VSSVEDSIDDLYKQPLSEFTATRNALAKSLSKDDAKRVKALAKPNLVPWAINQVYWRARGVYDRLLKAGDRLRKAQIAALEGKSADVRAASDAHRHAIAEAVAEAERQAGASGSKPSADALTRSFEALSLAAEPLEPHGRFTEAMQPAGFEALVGITPAKPGVGGREPGASRESRVASQSVDRRQSPVGSHSAAGGRAAKTPRPTREERRAAEREERERAEREAAARQHEAELKKADATVARAEAHEKLARETWERAHDALLDARKARDDVRRRA
jgi:hypothetical protein